MYGMVYEDDNNGGFVQHFVGVEMDEFRDQFTKLYETYNAIAIITENEHHIKPLKPIRERKCRFCGKQAPEVKFKKVAHLVPELLGNKLLKSDFECDQCNLLFGKYEDHLANYLGVSRSIGFINAKEGVPKFKSPDKNFIIKTGKLPVPGEKKGLIIESHGLENKHFTFDDKKKTITIHATRHSFKPFNVYKAILKIALSIIPENEIGDYPATLKLLLSQNDKEMKDNPFYRIGVYSHSGNPYPSPLLLLFRKKDEYAKQAYPTHIFCILFQNTMFQLYLPYNNKDQWMYDGVQSIKLIHIPPFIDKYFAAKFGVPKGRRIDFSSIELRKAELQNFSLSFESFEDSGILNQPTDGNS